MAGNEGFVLKQFEEMRVLIPQRGDFYVETGGYTWIFTKFGGGISRGSVKVGAVKKRLINRNEMSSAELWNLASEAGLIILRSQTSFEKRLEKVHKKS